LALGVAEHTPVFVHDRLLGARDGRRLFHRVYVPVAITAENPELADNPYREPAGLYDILATRYGPLHWTETVRSRIPSADDIATLRLPDATPILAIRRITHTPDGRALAVEDTQLSAEDSQLTYALPPAAASPERGKSRR
jgi:GntR family transcriptional regulator